jgi:hypothetical protein
MRVSMMLSLMGLRVAEAREVPDGIESSCGEKVKKVE